MSAKLKPFKHQQQSIKFFAKTPLGLDLSDPGTGKTAVHILAAQGKTLVLAPKTLLWAAWAEDIERFAPDKTYSIATAENRAKAFAQPADFYITNHDAAKWLAEQPKGFFKQFTTLVIDESTAYKHATSDRSKAVAKIAKHFELRRVLTGTITANSITDMWHQVKLADNGKRLGTSFFAFRSAVCTPMQVGPSANMVRWVDKDGAEAAVLGLVQDITIRHRFADCIDIPPNHEYTVPVQLSAKHRAAYEQMRDLQILWLKDHPSVTAINAAAVTTKLLQICSGAVYNDDGERAATLVDTTRYELVADLAEAREHVVVFFNWQHQKDQLQKLFTKRGLSHTLIDGTVNDSRRAEAVRGFQAGAHRILLAHPQAAGHGLTLTKATATIWCGPTYNLEHYLQGKRRIDRPGQTQKTETIVLVAKDTIEEHVWEVMNGKRERQNVLLDYLAETKRAA